MNDRTIYAMSFLAVLGTGLVAGVFLAFSSFVMAALARLPTAGGISAMQSINVTVINPLFMAVLFGTGVACLALGYSVVRGEFSGPNILMIAGVALYLVGTIVITLAFNVPLNDMLAGLDPNGSEAATQWKGYLRNWTFWNHVRGLAAFLACGAFARALSLSS